MKIYQLKIFLLTLFIPYFSVAQNQEENLSVKDKGFKIGMHFSSDISYRSLHSADVFPFVGIIDSRNKTETPKFAMSTGLVLEYSFTRTISISSGLSYLNQGFKSDWVRIVNPSIPDSSYGRAKSTYNYHFLSIPLMINTSIGKKKIKFFTATGLSFDFFLMDKTKTIIERGQETQTVKSSSNYDYNSFNMSALLSLGAEFNTNAKHIFRIAPFFRYNLLAMIDAPIHQRMFNAGINFNYLFASKSNKK